MDRVDGEGSSADLGSRRLFDGSIRALVVLLLATSANDGIPLGHPDPQRFWVGSLPMARQADGRERGRV